MADLPILAVVVGRFGSAPTHRWRRCWSEASPSGYGCGSAGRDVVGLAASTVYWLATPMLMSIAPPTAQPNGPRRACHPRGCACDIWSFAAARITEKPLIGWGLDASRTWPGTVPLHTHDAAIQVWLELGSVGGALAAAFSGWMIWSIGQMDDDRTFAAAAFAAMVTYLAIGAVSFGVWQEWWVGLGAITFAALLTLRRWRRGEAILDADANTAALAPSPFPA